MFNEIKLNLRLTSTINVVFLTITLIIYYKNNIDSRLTVLFLFLICVLEIKKKKKECIEYQKMYISKFKKTQRDIVYYAFVFSPIIIFNLINNNKPDVKLYLLSIIASLICGEINKNQLILTFVFILIISL